MRKAEITLIVASGFYVPVDGEKLFLRAPEGCVSEEGRAVAVGLVELERIDVAVEHELEEEGEFGDDVGCVFSLDGVVKLMFEL
jgi:hypothetical protein